MPWLDCVSFVYLLSLKMIFRVGLRAHWGRSTRVGSRPVKSPRELRRAARRKSLKNFRAARRRVKFLRGVRAGRESRYNHAR